MGNICIGVHKSLSDEVLNALMELEHAIFERPYSRGELIELCEMKSGLLILLAKMNGTACGYKMGYCHSSNVFYSWIGGVHPEFRGRGIAKKLMAEQHRLLHADGYECVRTHTKNKYREMLILNLKFGFSITGFYHRLEADQPGIILEKKLGNL